MRDREEKRKDKLEGADIETKTRRERRAHETRKKEWDERDMRENVKRETRERENVKRETKSGEIK